MSFARFFSIITHPVLMPFLCFYISIQVIPNSLSEDLLFIYLTFFLFSIFLPSLTTFLLFKKGKINSLEMDVSKERTIPLIINAVFLFFAYTMLSPFINTVPLLKAQILGVIIIMVITSFISRFWKISLHMIGVGGLIGALLAMQYFYQGSLYLILISVFLSIVIALARIKEKSHSYPQLYAGLFLGVFLESLIMILY